MLNGREGKVKALGKFIASSMLTFYARYKFQSLVIDVVQVNNLNILCIQPIKGQFCQNVYVGTSAYTTQGQKAVLCSPTVGAQSE